MGTPTDLFDVSLYGNFSAASFDYVPSRAYKSWAIDDELPTLLPKELLTAKQELWLFGPVIHQPLTCTVRSFALQPEAEAGIGTLHRIVLDSWHFVDDLTALGQGKNVVALFDVELLASLFDPRPCLAALKRIMKMGDVDCIFVQRRDEGRYTRYWKQRQFERFLRSSGFEILDSKSSPRHSYVVHARLSTRNYQQYLEKMNLGGARLSTDFLLITTEDAALQRTGGIGTYVANVRHLNPNCVVLFAAVGTGVENGGAHAVIAEKMLGGVTHEQMFEGEGLVEAVRVILYTLPNIAVCEFQDYQSVGFRVVQARKSGGLPPDLSLRVFAHGNLDYVKHGIGTLESGTYNPAEIRAVTKDRFIFANVDEVVTPSKYLLDLLQHEFGYDLSNARVQRLPFDLNLIGQSAPIAAMVAPEFLVYIGKFSVFKGWNDFVQAIEIIGRTSGFGTIRDIIVLSPGDMPPEDRKRIEKYLPCKHLHLTHAELISFLLDHNHRALFVVPAGGENYPFVVLELMLATCRFVGYRRGGALEVVDDPAFCDRFFAEPNPICFAKKIQNIGAASCESITQVVHGIARRIWERQVHINNQFKTTTVPNVEDVQKFDEARLDDISVATPIHNTQIDYLEELANSLRCSTLKAKEWILVNDGSNEDYSLALRGFADRHTDLKPRLIEQGNTGLAGARNRGLVEARTKLLCFIDADDVLLPHTLAHACLSISIQAKPTLAVSGYAVGFETSEKLPKDVRLLRNGIYWKPLGVSGARALSLYQNEFLTSCSLFNVDLARRIGGWDDSVKATWEDWAFYLKAAWSGELLLLMPWAGFLYRNTPGSMSKTYNQYFGLRQLARNIPAFDRFEANAILGLIRHQMIAAKDNKVSSEPSTLKKILIVIWDGLSPKTQKWIEPLADVIDRWIK